MAEAKLVYNGRNVNPNKLIKLSFGGKSWQEAFVPSGGNIDDYFAPGLDVAMVLDSDFKITSSSEYSKPMETIFDKVAPGVVKFATASSALNGIVQGAAAGIGGSVESLAQAVAMPPNVRYQTAFTQLPAWDKSSLIQYEGSLSFTFNFGMTGLYDGRTEVYNPVIALASVHLPTKTGSTRLLGPMPTTNYVYGLLASKVLQAATGALTSGGGGGSDAFDAISSVEQAFDSAFGQVEADMFNEYSGWPGIIEMAVGRLRLPKFYIKGASYTFSPETDSNGFPIWGKVEWNGISTLEVAHKNTESYKLYDNNFNVSSNVNTEDSESARSNTDTTSILTSSD